MTESVAPRTQLARNALGGWARYSIAALLALVVTPYALDVLGRDRFGVWALAGAVFAVLQLLDLGVSRSVTRSVAEATGRGDDHAAVRAISAGRAVAVFIAIASTLVVWLGRDYLAARVFRVPADLLAEAAYVIAGTALVAAVQLAFAPSSSAIEGIGRMDVASAIDGAQRIASSLGVVIVLSLGWGLPGLVWKNLATAVGAGLGYRLALRRLAPTLAASPIRADARATRGLLGFGAHVQLVNAGSALVEPLSKTILARGVGLEAVALFELAWRVVATVAAAFLSATASLFPAAASLRSTGPAGADDVAAMLAWSRRLLGWAAVPAFALLAAVAALFVETWLGTGYEPVAWSMAILALGWLAAVLSVPTFLVLQATGQEALSTRASLVTATAAIGLAGVLAPGFGLAGVTVGVALGLGAGALAILVLHARAAHQPRLAWPVDVRVLVAAAFGASAAFGLSAGLPAGWLPLLASGGAGAAVYVVVLWLIGGARPGEIAALWRLLRGNPRPGAEP